MKIVSLQFIGVCSSQGAAIDRNSYSEAQTLDHRCPAARHCTFAVNTRLHRNDAPLFARCRLAIVYSVLPLRAAVKFSTLQSYEFVAANAIIIWHIFVAPSASYSSFLPYCFFDPVPLFRPFPYFATGLMTTSSFTTRDILYPKYYARSPALGLRTYLRLRATYAHTGVILNL